MNENKLFIHDSMVLGTFIKHHHICLGVYCQVECGPEATIIAYSNIEEAEKAGWRYDSVFDGWLCPACAKAEDE